MCILYYVGGIVAGRGIVIERTEGERGRGVMLCLVVSFVMDFGSEQRRLLA